MPDNCNCKSKEKSSDQEAKVKSISLKLEEGNVKAAIRLAASEDRFAPFSPENYKKLLEKHPCRSLNNIPDPDSTESILVSDYDVYKAIQSFPNGSGAGPNCVAPQVFKDLTNKSNGDTGLDLLKSLTKLINTIIDGKEKSQMR